MLETMQTILLGNRLSHASRDMLQDWMIAAQTGQKRIRAGVPANWRVGDKTASGENATANTIAILYPPARTPILAAVYYTQSRGSEAERNGVHADVGRLIAELS
jgi:beta-lactamase class A